MEPVYDFRSDNVGGAAPEILEAIVVANAGTASPFPDGPVYAWTPGASWRDRATYSPQVPP